MVDQRFKDFVFWFAKESTLFKSGGIELTQFIEPWEGMEMTRSDMYNSFGNSIIEPVLKKTQELGLKMFLTCRNNKSIISIEV